MSSRQTEQNRKTPPPPPPPSCLSKPYFLRPSKVVTTDNVWLAPVSEILPTKTPIENADTKPSDWLVQVYQRTAQ